MSARSAGNGGQGGNGGHPRLAAIDIGTNTIRLVVAEVLPDRSYRLIDDERVVARLGRGLYTTGRLAQDAMEEGARATAHLKSIADGYGVLALKAAATAAVREAANGQDFVDLVRELAGIEVWVISAEEEARLAFRSAASDFDLRSVNSVVIDVGGGSTEIVLASGAVIERICTLDLGAVRLSEMLDLSDVVTTRRYDELRRVIRRAVRESIGRPPFSPNLAVGMGGTFTNLASMCMHRDARGRVGDILPYAMRGYELHRAEVKHFLDRLRKLPLRERGRVDGLNPQRADIIVAGLAIVDGVVKHLGVNRMRVHEEGIRAGILHTLIDEIQPAGATDRAPVQDRMRAVQQFAEACHHERAHANHVAGLALQLYDELARETGGEGWASPENRQVLEAAALLHDVGYLINYSRHHKHTYHLIMHSRMSGFARAEIELIANVARYHRGARPKRSHPNFARMDGRRQRTVFHLAAILRLAVGFDRAHAQSVSGIGVRFYDGMAIIEVRARHDPEVEIWGAQRKSRLFEKTFGAKARFHWLVPDDVGSRGADRPSAPLDRSARDAHECRRT